MHDHIYERRTALMNCLRIVGCVIAGICSLVSSHLTTTSRLNTSETSLEGL